MNLCCLGSSSKGNCYLLKNEKEVLILDCGIDAQKIKKGLNWDISSVVGVLLSHKHSDHSKSFKEFLMSGIPVYTNDETADYFETITGERMIGVPERIPFHCGGFKVTPFYLPHTTRDKETGKLIPCPNFGYLVEHEEMGKLLYMTDMEYCPYNFKSLRVNHLVLECNYSKDFVSHERENYRHVLMGHCSDETCRGIVKANMTRDLRTVTLIHLSSENADESQMLSGMREVVGSSVEVNIAKRGLEVGLNLFPF